MLFSQQVRSASLRPHGPQPSSSCVHGISQAGTRSGSPLFPQQVFLAQGLGPNLLLGGWPLYCGVTWGAFPSAELSIKIQGSGLLESSETRRRGVRGQARLPEAGPGAGLAPLERPRPMPEHASCPRTLLTSPSAFLPLHRCARSPGLEARF